MNPHNLHTHTTLSDGMLAPEELVALAKERNLHTLGITDHAFSTKLPRQYQVTQRLTEYFSHLHALAQSTSGIDLKIGLEVDVSLNFGIDPRKLPFAIINQLDFVLLEYVNTDMEYWGQVGLRPIEEVVPVLQYLDIPVGLAHNDLQGNFPGREEEVAEILGSNEIFVELNQSEYHPHRRAGRNTRSGQDYYLHFSPQLIEALRDNGVRVTIGTDTHTGESVGEISSAADFIATHHLKCHPLAE